MATTLPMTSANPHIAALQPVFDQAKTPIEWLVIAHNDSRLMNKLSSALAGESAAVLQASQDTWDFESKEFTEVIEWALQQGAIKNLILVGSTLAAGAMSQASLVSANKADANQTGYGRLLQGAQRHHAQNREIQQAFAGQVRRMSQIPVVHDCRCNGELQLYGIFHRAEGGLFLAYGVETDTFQPLFS